MRKLPRHEFEGEMLTANDIKIIILDIDGTIVKPWSAELLHGRKRKLEQLRAEGKRLFMASNQGGPAFHAWHAIKNSGRKREYPALTNVVETMESIRTQIGAEKCYIALHPGQDDIANDLMEKMQIDPTHPISFMGGRVMASHLLEWRKPRAGMIEQIMNETKVALHEAIYVGNQTTDFDAARAAGIGYADTDEFFFGEGRR